LPARERARMGGVRGGVLRRPWGGFLCDHTERQNGLDRGIDRHNLAYHFIDLSEEPEMRPAGLPKSVKTPASSTAPFLASSGAVLARAEKWSPRWGRQWRVARSEGEGRAEVEAAAEHVVLGVIEGATSQRAKPVRVEVDADQRRRLVEQVVDADADARIGRDREGPVEVEQVVRGRAGDVAGGVEHARGRCHGRLVLRGLE